MNQEIHLIPRIREEIKKNQIFNDIGIDDVSKIIDKQYTKSPWLLYGSQKNERQEAYKISSIFDADCEEITLKDAFENYNIYDDSEKKS